MSRVHDALRRAEQAGLAFPSRRASAARREHPGDRERRSIRAPTWPDCWSRSRKFPFARRPIRC